MYYDQILIDLYLYHVLPSFNYEQIKEIVFNFYFDNLCHVNIINCHFKWLLYFWGNSQLCIGFILCLFKQGTTNIQERFVG